MNKNRSEADSRFERISAAGSSFSIDEHGRELKNGRRQRQEAETGGINHEQSISEDNGGGRLPFKNDHRDQLDPGLEPSQPGC